MTSDEYRALLATKKCPHCQKPFRTHDMGMYGDAYGWILEDAGFPYTLYGYCTGCKKEVSLKELGFAGITRMSQTAISDAVH